MIATHGFIDIIIKRKSLDRKEEGLSQKLIEKYKLHRAHYDEDLICLPGAMGPYEAEMFVNELMDKYDLKFLSEDEKAIDLAITEAYWGLTTKCDWLQEAEKGKIYDFDGKKYPPHMVYIHKGESYEKDFK